MNQDSFEELDKVINDASLELFAAYQVHLEAGRDLDKTADVFAAAIGFTSPILTGAISITLCRELAVQSLPARGPDHAVQAPDDNMVADWTGELANQLLGRIKKKFIPFGVEIAISTPVVVKGRGLNLYPQQTDVCRIHGYGHGTSAFQVAFQARAPKDFEFKALSSCVDTGLEEGDVALF